jgi:hypothetical protein
MDGFHQHNVVHKVISGTDVDVSLELLLCILSVVDTEVNARDTDICF